MIIQLYAAYMGVRLDGGLSGCGCSQGLGWVLAQRRAVLCHLSILLSPTEAVPLCAQEGGLDTPCGFHTHTSPVGPCSRGYPSPARPSTACPAEHYLPSRPMENGVLYKAELCG